MNDNKWLKRIWFDGELRICRYCKQCCESGSRQFIKVNGGLSAFRLRVADRENLSGLVLFEFCDSGQSFADFLRKYRTDNHVDISNETDNAEKKLRIN